ncbi:fructosamine kinase family protein [Nocardia sp. CS682]|uniref:fructosamine kinase family protein n=1 Tax=Nocardia sp. CS682 TaxID=1047172 RepID=UPI001074D9BC|nr:fructosamine kinase family protein [Nocardia sp. CS682]QBS38961.1 fructosamine kinase [Nocardia sp. CS682]
MTLADHLGALLDTPVRAVTDLGASHEWTTHRATLADGREVFVKAAVEPTTVFAAEAAGLRWLATGSADGLRGSARPDSGESMRQAHSRGPTGGTEADTAVGHASALLPAVLAADDRMIVLPWLDDTGATPDTAAHLGRELAALHANTPTKFGAPWPGWIAELPLDNTLSAGPWPQWYAERRLAPYLPRAAAHLGPDGTHLLEQVIDRIETLAGPPEPPARIHGDLWSGNIVWTPDRAVLIDPAAHGGHRETDLAVLALFGAPHLDRILNAYNETHPLADGWRTRIPLHQLHHLLVHVVLFGASYRAQTLAAATAALRG